MIPRLLNEVVEELKARGEVDAILLGGSRAEGGTPDQDSDWDLYVYLASPLDQEVRRRILSPRTTVLELDNRFWETEDDGELNDGSSIELIYRHWDTLDASLDKITEQLEVSAGYSTCLWHNLLHSEILFDRAGRARQIKTKYAIPYPDALKRAIVKKNWPLLNRALPNYRDQAALAVKRTDVIAIQHRTAAFLASAFDLVFAANGKTHPGEKRLAQRSAQLPALPSDWLNLLSAVDRAGQGSRMMLVAALDTLAEALEVFLVHQGLLEAPLKKAPAAEKRAASEASVPATPGVLTVFTDGGCLGNPGKGAWAYLIAAGGLPVEETGGDPLTTNNKMELQAVIEALSAIGSKPEWRGRRIQIHTDSQYVRNGITTWVKTWSANGWKTSAKEPVKNQELWKQLQTWDQALHPEWKWVKGHAGNPNNERCDALVRRTMEQM